MMVENKNTSPTGNSNAGGSHEGGRENGLKSMQGKGISKRKIMIKRMKKAIKSTKDIQLKQIGEEEEEGEEEVETETPLAVGQMGAIGAVLSGRIDEMANGGNISEKENDEMDLLSEGQLFLAMSMLVYIYAQLREMSILGYTRSNFRSIDINSPHPWSPPDQDNTGLDDSSDDSSEGDDDDDEDSDEDSDDDGEDSENVGNPKSSLEKETKAMKTTMNAHNPEVKKESHHINGYNLDTVEYLANTKTAGNVIRIVLDESEREKETFQDDGELLGFKREHHLSVINEFRKWVDDSRSNQLDAAAEKAIIKLRGKVARARWRRVVTAARTSVALKHLMVEHEDGVTRRSRGINLDSELRNAVTNRRKHFEEMSDSSGKDWYQMQRLLIEDHFGISSQTSTSSSPVPASPDAAAQSTSPVEAETFLATNDAANHINKAMIDKAVEESLASFFRPGSVLSRMVKSGVEVVWFGDRHPNEAIYCLCVDRKKKNVIVVFRGSVTSHNWVHNMKFMMSEQENPVASEQYAGRADQFMVHTGFGLYLLRNRKDGEPRKLDEIMTKVHAIGNELDPNGNYRVSITGHSLGGALATMLSIYMAADPRFTKVSPVRVFTFAAPRVGGDRFRCAYRHLEETGRLLHARFRNTGDFVPLTPPFDMNGFKIGPFYKHVGLQVTLHGSATTIINKCGYETQYPLKTGFWNDMARAINMNLLTNLHKLGSVTALHILSAHNRRIHFARIVRKGITQTAAKKSERSQKWTTLEEYYQAKANVPYDAAVEERLEVAAMKQRQSAMLSGIGFALVGGVVVALLVTSCLQKLSVPLANFSATNFSSGNLLLPSIS